MDKREMRKVGAAILVIALTNAVALLGVARNRQEPPESVLTLTERELSVPRSFMGEESENSGLSVKLEWRTEAATDDDDNGSSHWGAASWLDKQKLAELGFDVTTPPDASEGDAHYRRMLARDVLLVLELDGPAHYRAVNSARRKAGERVRQAATNPSDKSYAERAQEAQRKVIEEETELSRLFVIDAALNASDLRKRYPDRARYAIVRGSVRPVVVGKENSKNLLGSISDVRSETINVPLEFRSKISVVTDGQYDWLKKPKPVQMQVMFGKRFEPWIVSAHART